MLSYPFLAFHSRAGRSPLPLRYSVLLQLIVQRLEADAENFGGAGFVVVGGFESLEDEHALGVVDGGAHFELDAIGIARRGGRGRVPKPGADGATVKLVAEDHGALDGVAQLAHVARPVDQAQHSSLSAAHVALVLGVHVLDQGLGEAGCLLVLAQRGMWMLKTLRR